MQVGAPKEERRDAMWTTRGRCGRVCSGNRSRRQLEAWSQKSQGGSRKRTERRRRLGV